MSAFAWLGWVCGCAVVLCGLIALAAPVSGAAREERKGNTCLALILGSVAALFVVGFVGRAAFFGI
jgi:hypothetical protein